MTDADFHKLMHELYRHDRRKTLMALRQGNDAGCFTTQQYMDAWRKVINHGKGKPVLWPELAIKHLRDGNEVAEMRPGVWVFRELLGE